MAMPAASSDELLIRLPVERLCIVFCMARSLAVKAFADISAELLVLITGIKALQLD
jgi:hypothetical protein